MAQDAGFSTIGEYLKNGNQLIQEQDRSVRFLDDYAKKMQQVEAEHRELARQYAAKKEETRRAIARMNQAPTGDTPSNPVASRKPGAAEQAPTPVAAAPAQLPNLSGFNFPSQAQAQADPASAPLSYPVTQPKAAMAEALPSFENNLEVGRRNEEAADEAPASTIATKENDKGATDKTQKIELVKAGGKAAKGRAEAKKSLRDALRAAMAKGSAGEGASLESGSQSATRALLEEASKATTDGQGRELASTGASNGFTAGAGGVSNSSLKGFGQPDLQSGALNLNGDGAQAQMSRLKNELGEEKAAPEVLGRESQDLFERVKGAHQRSQKNGRVALKT